VVEQLAHGDEWHGGVLERWRVNLEF